MWCWEHGFTLLFCTFLLGDDLAEARGVWDSAWVDQVVARRRFAFHVYPSGEHRRMSFRRLDDKDGWIDLGVVEGDAEVEARFTRTRDFVSGAVWARVCG